MTHRKLLGAAAAATFLAVSAGTALANPRPVQSSWSHQRMTLPRPPDRVVHIKPLVPFTPQRSQSFTPLYLTPFGYSPYAFGYSPFGFSPFFGFGGLGYGLSPFTSSVCQAAYGPTLGDLADGGAGGFAPFAMGDAPPVATSGLAQASPYGYGYGASPYCQNQAQGPGLYNYSF